MQGHPLQGADGAAGHGQQQGFSPPEGGGGMGRLELHSSFFPLMWFLFFTSLRVTINGHEQLRKWGTAHLDLPAGVHHVRVHFPNLFGPGGVAERQVQIWPGHATRLRYEAPLLFAALRGTIADCGTQPIVR
jgi:hypothetical protein